jgi:deazaflavin-dependent oxidoreductase (nitroreductase family)
MNRPDATSRSTRMAWIRPFTNGVVNRLTRPLAPWLPLFGVLTYRGRTSGRTYRTPLNVFRRGDHYVFALTYGGEVQWVKNVLTSGEAELRTRGRDVHLVDPERYQDDGRRDMPPVVRQFLGLMRVTEFLRMRIDAPPER